MPRGQSCLLEAIKSITYSQYAINREHKPIVTAVFSLGGGAYSFVARLTSSRLTFDDAPLSRRPRV